MVSKVLKRIKNPKVILAVISGFLMILLNLGLIDEMVSNKVIEVTNMLLSLGVTVGIFANPESHIESDK